MTLKTTGFHGFLELAGYIRKGSWHLNELSQIADLLETRLLAWRIHLFPGREAAVSPSTAVSTLKEVSSGAAECRYWKGRFKEGSLEEASFLRMCRSDSDWQEGAAVSKLEKYKTLWQN